MTCLTPAELNAGWACGNIPDRKAESLPHPQALHWDTASSTSNITSCLSIAARQRSRLTVLQEHGQAGRHKMSAMYVNTGSAACSGGGVVFKDQTLDSPGLPHRRSVMHLWACRLCWLGQTQACIIEASCNTRQWFQCPILIVSKSCKA